VDDPQHERVYRLIQTVVRRIRDGEAMSPRAKSGGAAAKTKRK
jgi:hypothetical protein